MTNITPNSQWYQTNFTGEALLEKLEYADNLDVLFLLTVEDATKFLEHMNTKWEIGDYDLKTGKICINILE